MARYEQLGVFTWHEHYFHGLSAAGKLAFIYILDRIMAGRDYLSLTTMARDTSLSLGACEQYVHQFAVDRQLPDVAVLEEQVE